jgi:ferrochelatase
VRRTGVLLVNLGTPKSPAVPDVRRYLREFLGDPRVLEMHGALRWVVLHLLILPWRAGKSGASYSRIWTDRGSPLLTHSRALAEAAGKSLGERFCVELAMRYGEPSIAAALGRLEAADVGQIAVLPLFPHYASSSRGSALERVYSLAGGPRNVPSLTVIPEFYDHPAFISALAQVSQPPLDDFRPDHVVLSFHGVPERELRRGDPSGTRCLENDGCCDQIQAGNRRCYRAQAHATSRALAASLGLAEDSYTVAFQSRLGRTAWIQPYTDRVLTQLAQDGVRRVAVLCPAFVADCLETLEEIGIRAREQWKKLGGEELLLVPCVNDHPAWVDGVAQMIRKHVGSDGD